LNVAIVVVAVIVVVVVVVVAIAVAIVVDDENIVAIECSTVSLKNTQCRN